MVWRRPKLWIVPLAVLTLALADAAGSLCLSAHAQQPGSKSWTDTITSPFKQGFDKLGHALNPKPSAPTYREDDAVSLKIKANPGPDLYVAIAHSYEQAGKIAEADQQYQLALKVKRDHLPALLGRAHAQEALGKPDEAIQIYQHAATIYPQEASIHNNLGLCFARQNRLDEAAAAMNRAVQLDPKNPRYRNNIATTLVDQGRMQEAMGHLQAVHNNAAAHYNMGYLLNKKGQSLMALQQFTLALKADPSMTAAKQWVQYLQKTTSQAQTPKNPIMTGVKITSQPIAWPQKDGTVPPDASTPRRLPPTNCSQAASEAPPLPGFFYDRSVTPNAPLPPDATASAVRPLPRVR